MSAIGWISNNFLKGNTGRRCALFPQENISSDIFVEWIIEKAIFPCGVPQVHSGVQKLWATPRC